MAGIHGLELWIEFSYLLAGMLKNTLISTAILGLAGCGATMPQKVVLRDMLGEAEASEVALLNKYSGKSVEVSGKVTVVSVHRQRAVEHKTGPGTYGGEVTSRYVQKKMPYLYVVPDDGKPGRALCFFEEQDYKALVDVRKGDDLTLRCWFQDYVVKGDDRVIVLNTCWIPGSE